MICLGYKIVKFSIFFYCKFVCEVCVFFFFCVMGRNSRLIRYKNMVLFVVMKIIVGVIFGIEFCIEVEKCK